MCILGVDKYLSTSTQVRTDEGNASLIETVVFARSYAFCHEVQGEQLLASSRIQIYWQSYLPLLEVFTRLNPERKSFQFFKITG